MSVRTKIEWCDYTINPVKGLCPVDCKNNQGKPYCYARRMYKRFKWNPEIRLDVDCFLPLLKSTHRKPSKIFVGSTIELFGDWVKPEWMQFIFERVRMLTEHTCIFLTKRPENLPKWNPWPDNCFVGATATDAKTLIDTCKHLAMVECRTKFISMEPFLKWDGFESLAINLFRHAKINWVIIGSQTQPVRHPKFEWVEEIVNSCDKAGIPVFIKEPLAKVMGLQRKELPHDC